MQPGEHKNENGSSSEMDEFTVISGEFTLNIAEDVAQCSLFVDDIVD